MRFVCNFIISHASKTFLFRLMTAGVQLQGESAEEAIVYFLKALRSPMISMRPVIWLRLGECASIMAIVKASSEPVLLQHNGGFFEHDLEFDFLQEFSGTNDSSDHLLTFAYRSLKTCVAMLEPIQTLVSQQSLTSFCHKRYYIVRAHALQQLSQIALWKCRANEALFYGEALLAQLTLSTIHTDDVEDQDTNTFSWKQRLLYVIKLLSWYSISHGTLNGLSLLSIMGLFTMSIFTIRDIGHQYCAEALCLLNLPDRASEHLKQTRDHLIDSKQESSSRLMNNICVQLLSVYLILQIHFPLMCSLKY